MRIREISTPKNSKYTIYKGEKPGAFHNSGIPMGTEIPRVVFMRGVTSKLINHIMDKLEDEVPSQKFYKELEEAPMNPFAKAAATVGAVAGMAGGVAADPGAIPGTEPQANPEYNIPSDDIPVQKMDIKKYEKSIKQIALSFMQQQKYFSGVWPKGSAGPKIIDSTGKVMMTTTEMGKNHIVLKTRYKEAWLGAHHPSWNPRANYALITIRFGDLSRGDQIVGKGYEINRPSPTTITGVELDVLNDGGADMARSAWKQFGKRVPHLSDQKYTKKGEMQRAGLYDLIGLDIDAYSTMANHNPKSGTNYKVKR